MAPAKAKLSEYEQRRQEQVAKNQALLRELALDAASAGLKPSASKANKPAASKSSKPKVKREKPAEPEGPRRTSRRLQGLIADSETAKRKAEEEHVAWKQAEQVKRQRVSGDLNVGDILVGGREWDAHGSFLRDVKPTNPYERTFTEQDIKSTTDKELRELRQRMQSLELYEGWEPNSKFHPIAIAKTISETLTTAALGLKITPERIVRCSSIN
jgi:WD repeat-containing protein 76